MNWWLTAKRARLLFIAACMIELIKGLERAASDDTARVPKTCTEPLPPRLARSSTRTSAPDLTVRATRIYGIRCTITDSLLRDALYVVLGTVREQHPDDFARLRRRVKRLAVLPRSVKNARGRWRARRGVILLSPIAEDLLAVVAHELGHACTTAEDMAKRKVAGRDWAIELSADSYVLKWGLGQSLDQIRPYRNAQHHGPAPGATVRLNGCQYRLTRQLLFRRLREGKDG